MAGELKYTAFRRSRLYDLTKKQDARMSGSLPLKLVDEFQPQDEVHGGPSFTLAAAADIAGLKPGAIKHMAPPPNSRDAETTKLVHIDFYEEDLPWRYTPQAAFVPTLLEPDNRVVRPWLVLLVGTADQIEVKGNIANVKPAVLAAHDLEKSYLWAHVQHGKYNDETQPVTISRILSPVALEAQREYVAVLVPAFNDRGEKMWKAGGVPDFDVLPAFHHWRFWTGEAGDFETLAAALHVPKGEDIGKAKLYYRRDVSGIDEQLEVRGAITSLQAEDEPAEDAIQAIQADVDTLNNEVLGTISLPHYGRPWLPDPDSIENGWPDDLNDDPRHRGVAGLGVWMGVEGQESLMDAAVIQAGALAEAGRLINYLALGLIAAGSLWERRLPQEANERLRILGPLMGRLPDGNGGLVLNRVTASGTPLPPALFSGAAQRLLRDRSTATRHISGAGGGLNRIEAMNAVNQPTPAPDLAPGGLPHILTFPAGIDLGGFLQQDEGWLSEILPRLDDISREVCTAYREKRASLFDSGAPEEVPSLRQAMAEELQAAMVELLEQKGYPCIAVEDLLMACELSSTEVSLGCYEHVLEDEPARLAFMDSLAIQLRLCLMGDGCERLFENIDIGDQDRRQVCRDLLGTFHLPPAPETKSINLDALAAALDKALDPRGERAPARLRVCSRIEGIDCTRLTRPEFPIRLDYPTWTLLNRYDKEWLLPGASSLEKDSITALQTNPTFIDAFMVGMNSQFLSEMRWRDLAVDRSITPLRMFWGQVNYATRERQADIEPFSEWVKDTDQPLGALAHQTLQPVDPMNESGSRLVIVFRSDLFRRYPGTLVYLMKRPDQLPGESDNDYRKRMDALLEREPDLSMPPGNASPNEILTWRLGREFFGPTMAANISPDITFFGFDVTPSTLDKYYLVLAEPPAELRFQQKKVPPNSQNSAHLAAEAIDKETRVAISGQYLEDQALIQ